MAGEEAAAYQQAKGDAADKSVVDCVAYLKLIAAIDDPPPLFSSMLRFAVAARTSFARIHNLSQRRSSSSDVL